ncbi:MAG: D-alanyl-D-alanine carboxypeptidase [Candidatus Carbobacillus altaicus]|nr:D-alanyl-D-alanine carboxypeptidase [Candidatus Carbobacillus altaicus]
MKKKVWRLFLLLVVGLTLIWPSRETICAEENGAASAETNEQKTVKTAPVDLAPSARAAILMDMDTGTVLYEKNADLPLPPASITKIMSLLVVMEALESGNISLDDQVVTSERAASMGGSQIFLKVGETMTVRDLLKAAAIASANDATVALAEYTYGSEEAFVERMNQRAKELEMRHTHFVNTTGLPAEGHLTSARDIAIMSRELLKHESILEYTGTYQDYLRQDTDKPFWLVNTNRLVRFYRGMDGLKTGYTSDARFGLSATAKRDELRLIAVVLGEPDTKTRNREVTAMLDWGFAHYTNIVIYEKDAPFTWVKVDGGKDAYVRLITGKKASVLVEKGTQIEAPQEDLILPDNLHAPLTKGTEAGKLIVSVAGKTVEIPLMIEADVPKADLGTVMKRTLHRAIFFEEEKPPQVEPEHAPDVHDEQDKPIKQDPS